MNETTTHSNTSLSAGRHSHGYQAQQEAVGRSCNRARRPRRRCGCGPRHQLRRRRVGARYAAAFPAIAPTCSTSRAASTRGGTGTVDCQQPRAVGAQNVPFLGFGVNSDPVALAGSANSTIKVAEGTTLTINFSRSGIAIPSIVVPKPAPRRGEPSGNGYTYHSDRQQGRDLGVPAGQTQMPRSRSPWVWSAMLIVTPAVCTGATLLCGTTTRRSRTRRWLPRRSRLGIRH